VRRLVTLSVLAVTTVAAAAGVLLVGGEPAISAPKTQPTETAVELFVLNAGESQTHTLDTTISASLIVFQGVVGDAQEVPVRLTLGGEFVVDFFVQFTLAERMVLIPLTQPITVDAVEAQCFSSGAGSCGINVQLVGS
jgi:hypothetical protein